MLGHCRLLLQMYRRTQFYLLVSRLCVCDGQNVNNFYLIYALRLRSLSKSIGEISRKVEDCRIIAIKVKQVLLSVDFISSI